MVKGRVVVGQADLQEQCVIALLCHGHVLLEGVPGIAKTLTVKTLSKLMRLDFQRVQCTSDLMPADIVGTNILNLATSSFQLHKGPVFTDLLLVDEVNRMPPRTQAALLECMEEHQVTIDGNSHQLSPFFTVFATQNPVEFEGTYPLPEAQLDRLLKVLVPYPELPDEVRLLANVQNGFESRELDKMDLRPIDPGLLEQAQQELKLVTVEEALFSYIVQIARRTREWPALSLGGQPARRRQPHGGGESGGRHGRARLCDPGRHKGVVAAGASPSHPCEAGSRSGGRYSRSGCGRRIARG